MAIKEDLNFEDFLHTSDSKYQSKSSEDKASKPEEKEEIESLFKEIMESQVSLKQPSNSLHIFFSCYIHLYILKIPVIHFLPLNFDSETSILQ